MTISSQFYNDTEGYWTGWQRHAQSVCFVLIACYYISVLYFLTMTAERAHNNLRISAANRLIGEVVQSRDGRL